MTRWKGSSGNIWVDCFRGKNRRKRGVHHENNGSKRIRAAKCVWPWDENTAYARYFSGQSFLNPLTKPESGLFLANVTFEPGCRNNWHIHHAKKGGGQLLICTAGEGWYQEAGKAPVSLTPGTVITIPPEVKHWHGAKKDSWFSHIAAEIPGEDTSNEWCEPVSDEEYNELEKY